PDGASTRFRADRTPAIGQPGGSPATPLAARPRLPRKPQRPAVAVGREGDGNPRGRARICSPASVTARARVGVPLPPRRGRPLAAGPVAARARRAVRGHPLAHRSAGCRTAACPPRRGGSGASVPGHGERWSDPPRIPRRSPDVLAGSQDPGLRRERVHRARLPSIPPAGATGGSRLGRDRAAAAERPRQARGLAPQGPETAPRWEDRLHHSRQDHLPGHLRDRAARGHGEGRLGVARPPTAHGRYHLAGAHASRRAPQRRDHLPSAAAAATRPRPGHGRVPPGSHPHPERLRAAIPRAVPGVGPPAPRDPRSVDSAGRGVTARGRAGFEDSPIFDPPSIVFEGRLWPADEVAAVAAGWLDVLRARIPRAARLTAMTLSNHPEAVALLFALSSLPLPVVVYPPDPRAWRSSPPLPEDTPLFIPPSLREMAPAGEHLGL